MLFNIQYSVLQQNFCKAIENFEKNLWINSNTAWVSAVICMAVTSAIIEWLLSFTYGKLFVCQPNAVMSSEILWTINLNKMSFFKIFFSSFFFLFLFSLGMKKKLIFW